jgi:hypothetical protein
MDKRNKQAVYSVLQPDISRAVAYATPADYPQAKGTLFKKRIINYGKYADQWMPDYFLELDAEWGKQVLDNFKAGTVGRVYVPSSHTDDPDKNRGEVIDMFEAEDGSGIDAIMDIRDPETVQKIQEDLIWDCSIGFTMNWLTKEGDEKGPAIYHVALVNNPYVEDMTPFEAFAKISEVCRAELAHSYQANAIMLSRAGIKKEFTMENVAIKNDKEFPVEVTYKEGEEDKTVVVQPGEEVQVPEDQKDAVTQIIADAEAPEEEEDEEETAEEKAAREAKEAKDAEDAAELSRVKAENAEFRKQAVNATYDKLLKEGKIVPAQERAFKALALAGDSKVEFSRKDGKVTQLSVSKLLEKLFATAPKVVQFSEKGSSSKDKGKKELDKDQTPYDKLSPEAKAGLKATGVTKERYNENVEKHPEMYPEHQTNESEEES